MGFVNSSLPTRAHPLCHYSGSIVLWLYNPKKPTDSIMPGVEEVIEVKYDTNRVGPIRKTITVSSNAVTPVVALQIKGTVEEPEEEE